MTVVSTQFKTLLAVLIVVPSALMMACQSGESDGDQPAVGDERGKCYPNGTCDEGLTCLSNRCVDWDSSQSGDTTSDTRSNTDGGDDEDAADSSDTSMISRDALIGDASEDVSSPPTAPTQLSATGATGPSVELSWSDNADNEAGFVLQRRDDADSASYQTLRVLSANSSELVDTDASKGFEYTYRVRAFNARGDSDWSNEASHQVPAPTLQEDVVPVFEETCGANNSGCHYRNMYYATQDRDCRGWLSLENASIGAYGYDENGEPKEPTGCQDRDLHYRLTQIRAWQCNDGAFVSGNANYVVPGNLDESYLWGKVTGNWICGDNSEMPPVGELSDQELTTIREWILHGAAE